MAADVESVWMVPLLVMEEGQADSLVFRSEPLVLFGTRAAAKIT